MSARRRHGTDEEDLSEGESEEKVELNNPETISDPEENKSSSENSESESDEEESVKENVPAAVVPSVEAVEQVQEDESVDLAKSMENLDLDKSDRGSDGEENEEANEDEDERHPAYIPRKGLFFLHDDRIDNEYPEGITGPKMDLEVNTTPPAQPPTAENEEQIEEEKEEENEEEEKEEKLPGDDEESEELKQPVELDQEAERAYRAARKAEKMGEKWSHDKYDDDMQNPRTQQELVDRYGFDIRTLNPDQVDFTRPLGQTGDETPPPSTQAVPPPASRRGGGAPTRGRGGGGDRGGRVSKNSNRQQRQERPKGGPGGASRGGGRQNQQNGGSMNGFKMEEFPELTVSINKKNNERQTQKAPNSKSTRTDPKTRKPRNADDSRSAKPLRPNKIESKRRESREKFKKAPMQRDEPRQGNNSRNNMLGVDKRQRNINAGGDSYDQYDRPQADNRLRKQERRRRVEQERENQLGLDTRRNGRPQLNSQGGQGRQGGQGGPRSPPPQRIQDPAPPIRSRRYSSDLSNEDIIERRRPPPPRRKKNLATSPQQANNKQNVSIKPQLQAEIANVADILAKHENQARKMSQKHDYDARMRESPVKSRRDDKRKEDRRRDQPDRSKLGGRIGGLAEEKSSKRYSARTRPEHWNNRQSPSPSSVNNDQNYNDRAQLPDDQVQDALEKHFNMSAPQAKKFVNQIKNQLHTPNEKIQSKSDTRFSQHGINVDPITSYPQNQDVKSNIQSLNAKMGSLRDRSNDQPSMQAYQAFQAQQQQQLQFIQQTQQNQHFTNDALDMVTRMAAQQDPSFFANQAAARQPAAIPPMYQQQSLHNNQMAQLSSPSGYVNTSSISQQQAAQLQAAQANPLIANGTTYFHNNLEQHNRGKY